MRRSKSLRPSGQRLKVRGCAEQVLAVSRNSPKARRGNGSDFSFRFALLLPFGENDMNEWRIGYE